MHSYSFFRRVLVADVLAISACAGGSAQSRAPVADPAPTPSPALDVGSTGPTRDAASATPASDAATVAVVDAGEDTAAPATAELPPMPTGLQGPPSPWARMNDRDRGRYMGTAIMPAMTQLLQAYDGAHFSRVRCSTCHGENAQQVHFRMPNTLAALPAWGTEASNRMIAAQPRMFQFMAQRVVPAMAQLLGEQVYNPQTRRGFGCFDCHPHAP